MNIHTRLVGAFDALMMALLGAVTIAMLIVLLDASFSPFELFGKRGTVTIQQIAMTDADSVRHL